MLKIFYSSIVLTLIAYISIGQVWAQKRTTVVLTTTEVNGYRFSFNTLPQNISIGKKATRLNVTLKSNPLNTNNTCYLYIKEDSVAQNLSFKKMTSTSRNLNFKIRKLNRSSSFINLITIPSEQCLDKGFSFYKSTNFKNVEDITNQPRLIIDFRYIFSYAHDSSGFTASISINDPTAHFDLHFVTFTVDHS